MAGTEYHKIWSPYKRYVAGPERGKFITGDWARPEFDVLQNQSWVWTEKINGTNCRIIWDGHQVRFGGRTDEANMSIKALEWLGKEFPEELLEQQFHANPAVLYGELCGAKMTSGSGVYGPDPRFIMFDVNVDGWWLLPPSVEQAALQMGIDFAPYVMTGSIGEAIRRIKENPLSSYGNFIMEGLVGRPPLGLLGRDGDRLLVKIKAKDFA